MAMSAQPAQTDAASMLPAPPAAIARILRVAGDAQKSLGELSELCAQDPGLTVELLRVANSARFGGKPVQSVPKAVVKLGARAVRAHSVTYAIRAAVSGCFAGNFDTAQFWEDSLRRAAAAQILASITGADDPFEAFAVGLMQDLGTLLLAVAHPHLGSALSRLRKLPSIDRCVRERALAGMDHSAFFAQGPLAQALPRNLVQVIVYHHQEEMPPNAPPLLRLAQAADYLADVVQSGANADNLIRATQALQGLKVKEELGALVDTLGLQTRRMGEELAIRTGLQPSMEMLLSQANLALMEITQQVEDRTRQLEAELELQEAEAKRLEAQNRELNVLAYQDALTGVDNRRSFLRQVKGALEKGPQIGRPVSILILDADHFKHVNDTWGHPAGDEVLKELATRIRKNVGGPHRVGRLGGEEFGLLLPGADARLAARITERIRAAIAASPVIADGTAIPVTASFGGTTYCPNDPPTSPEALLEVADKELYRAKRSGRNRVCWSS
jgi:diguanylate cyclase (GGDEF)-like protein